MKKKIYIIVCLLIIFVAAILGYVWFVKPIKCEISLVMDNKTFMNDYVINEIKKTKEIYNNNFEGKLPSSNYKDYRTIWIELNIDNRSVIDITSAVAIVDNIISTEKDRVIKIASGEIEDGEKQPDNFCKKSIVGLKVVIYTGDLNSEDEIMKVISELLKNGTIKVYYNMKWLGNKEYNLNINRIPVDKIEFSELEE